MATKLHKNNSDEELIALFKATKNNYYLGLLLDRYTLLLLGTAMKHLKNIHLAKDAVQQIFLKVIDKFPDEPILNIKGWLYVLMRNHCINQLKISTFEELDTKYLDSFNEDNSSKEEWLLLERKSQKLLKAIEQLNTNQKICIQMFYIDEYSYKEIMTRTNLTFEMVKSNIQNGKRNLKIILSKSNIEET